MREHKKVVRLCSFPPVIDRNTRVLILGSFPGVESLRRQQYYGHPQNAFWGILGEIVGEDMVTMPYSRRLATLRKNGIGLWDVIGTCKRDGSLDSDIKDEAHNDFALLKKRAPGITHVFFNGKKAGTYQRIFTKMGYTTTVLPSTSPANAGVTMETKRKEWGRVRTIL